MERGAQARKGSVLLCAGAESSRKKTAGVSERHIIKKDERKEAVRSEYIFTGRFLMPRVDSHGKMGSDCLVISILPAGVLGRSKRKGAECAISAVSDSPGSRTWEWKRKRGN